MARADKSAMRATRSPLGARARPRHHQLIAYAAAVLAAQGLIRVPLTRIVLAPPLALVKWARACSVTTLRVGLVGEVYLSRQFVDDPVD